MNPIPAARIVIPAEDRREILARIDEALCTGALTLGRNGEAFEFLVNGRWTVLRWMRTRGRATNL